MLVGELVHNEGAHDGVFGLHQYLEIQALRAFLQVLEDACWMDGSDYLHFQKSIVEQLRQLVQRQDFLNQS